MRRQPHFHGCIVIPWSFVDRGSVAALVQGSAACIDGYPESAPLHFCKDLDVGIGAINVWPFAAAGGAEGIAVACINLT
jgi:hypothetical protein